MCPIFLRSSQTSVYPIFSRSIDTVFTPIFEEEGFSLKKKKKEKSWLDIGLTAVTKFQHCLVFEYFTTYIWCLCIIHIHFLDEVRPYFCCVSVCCEGNFNISRESQTIFCSVKEKSIVFPSCKKTYSPPPLLIRTWKCWSLCWFRLKQKRQWFHFVTNCITIAMTTALCSWL